MIRARWISLLAVASAGVLGAHVLGYGASATAAVTIGTSHGRLDPLVGVFVPLGRSPRSRSRSAPPRRSGWSHGFVTDRGLGCKVVRLGLRAPYAHGASKAHLLQEYGLDEWALVRTAEAELGRDLGITENEVLAAPVDAKASLVSAESL